MLPHSLNTAQFWYWLFTTWSILYSLIDHLDMWMKLITDFALWAYGEFDLAALSSVCTFTLYETHERNHIQLLFNWWLLGHRWQHQHMLVSMCVHYSPLTKKTSPFYDLDYYHLVHLIHLDWASGHVNDNNSTFYISLNVCTCFPTH